MGKVRGRVACPWCSAQASAAVLEMVADVNPAWAEAAARNLGLPAGARTGADGRRPAGRRGRHHRAERRAPRDRARRARRRQAGLRGSRSPTAPSRRKKMAAAAAAAGVPTGRLQLPEEPGASVCARADRRGRTRRDYAVSRRVRSGPASDPDFPFTWRHERAVAGSGALGDMGSRMALQYLIGDVAEVCSMCETFIRERPLAASGTGQSARAAAGASRRRGRERRYRPVSAAL